MCRSKKRLLVGVATILILCLALMGQAFTVYAVDAVSASQNGSEIPSGGGQVRNSITTYWNVGSQGRLTIPANSNSDYEITGSYTGVGHIVTVALGYKGTITLNNATLYTTNDTAPIMLLGSGLGDMPTQTDVTLVLVGNNKIWYAKGLILSYGADNNFAALHISVGTKCTITGNGSLDARVMLDSPNGSYGASPAIGCSLTGFQYSSGLGSGANRATFSGGDLVIKSGTILARGSVHAAGIGGGFNNMRTIVITGGDITSVGGDHGSGIGGGCQGSSGTVVVVPPTKITATGKGGLPLWAVGDSFYERMANIFYLGDPNQKKLRVTAQQLGGTSQIGRKNVNILFDVSDDSIIASALELAGLNPSKWFAGTTEDKGYWETTGKIAGTVKVYSDTFTPRSTEDQKEYYSSKRVAIDGSKDVHVVLEEPDLTMKYLDVTKTPETWNANSVTLRASALAVTPSVVRIRERNGVWVETSNYIERVVTQNGTYYFEAENSDGNTQTVSCVVDNIDKSRPVVKHDSG